jgi:Zn-dependent peptidase ImmA (M78 family)
MCELLGAPYKRVQSWARRHGYNMKRTVSKVDWPSEAAWWRGRTAEQISKELRVSITAVYYRARRFGFIVKKPLMSPYDYRANQWKHKATPKDIT